MNKQRYLGELARLLVFMTAEDQETVVRRYGELFDQVGPDVEDMLIEYLGSPTKNAIRLSRGYEPGVIPELPSMKDVPGQAMGVATAAPQSMPAAGIGNGTAAFSLNEGENADESVPWADLPTFELPDVAAGIELSPEEEPAVTEEETALDDGAASESAEPEASGGAATEDTGEPEAPASVAEETAGAAKHTASPEESHPLAREAREQELPAEQTPLPPKPPRFMPLWVGVPLFVVVMLALGLPLAAVVIGLFVALLVPGCALLVAAWLVFVGGLWCISYIADAVMMFGVAFIVLALGLAALWLGLWLGVVIAKLYVRGVGGMGRLCFGRKGASKNA